MVTYDRCIIEKKKKTWHTAGKLGGVLPNGCPRSAALLAVVCWMKKQSTPYSPGMGEAVLQMNGALLYIYIYKKKNSILRRN